LLGRGSITITSLPAVPVTSRTAVPDVSASSLNLAVPASNCTLNVVTSHSGNPGLGEVEVIEVVAVELLLLGLKSTTPAGTLTVAVLASTPVAPVLNVALTR
jgi:hypothetical protein